ncbi:pyruvate dehydrogenase (acetyl-transferring) E1 component subunit alpha [Sediminivirga luteola]
MIQMLTPEGKRVPGGEYERFAEDLDDEMLRLMYRDMTLSRRVDAEGTALQRQGQLGLWVPLLGQEAAQIGLGRATRPQDFIFPSYREHGLALTRGVPPETLLGIFRGVSHSGWDPQAHNLHPYAIVIGAQTLHAVGYAMGVQLDGDIATGDQDRDTATIACFGDGATSQGEVSEALTFAGTYNAPVLFFLQNNQWAISEPTTVQTKAPLHTRGVGFGVPGVRVDGNDVIATYAVARAGLDSIRAGNGPLLLEAYTYRMGAHTTADDPTKYRSDAETENWRAKDPIRRLRRYLLESEMADQEFFDGVDAEADELAAGLRKACVEMPDPDPQEMFSHVYSHEHALVSEESAWHAQYEASFAEAEAR